MIGMRRATKWLGALVFGLCVALIPGSAQAAFLAGGTTSPVKGIPGSASGTVDVQVYTLDGGGSYGTGNAAADLAIALGLPGAGVNPFLYLYETGNTGPDISNNTVKAMPGAAPGIVGFQFAAIGGGAAGDPSGFTPLGARAIVGADGASFGPSIVSATPTSVSATYIPALAPPFAHSVLWGYTSAFGPSLVSTTLQDGGTSAEGTSLAAVPEPASILMLGCGAAGMLGYGWKRRKVTV